jgi:hypothetical protein
MGLVLGLGLGLSGGRRLRDGGEDDAVGAFVGNMGF